MVRKFAQRHSDLSPLNKSGCLLGFDSRSQWTTLVAALWDIAGHLEWNSSINSQVLESMEPGCFLQTQVF